MKLCTCRKTATVLTMAVGGQRVFPAQQYKESIITVTEKVVNVKWGGI